MNPGIDWLSLILVSVITLGSAISYDSISAIAPFIKAKLLLSSEDIGELYSAYHFPNVIVVFIGGILTDRIGSYRATILFSSLVTLGSALVTLGHFPVMIFGRLLFGLGAESLYSVQLAILTNWFKDKEFPSLAFSCTIALSFTRIGTISAFNILPIVASYSLRSALLIVCLFDVISLLAGFAIAFLASRYLLGNESHEPEETPLSVLETVRVLVSNRRYLLLSFLCMFHYTAIITFSDFSTDFFSERFHLSAQRASSTQSITTIMTLFIMPIAGYYCDKTGLRMSMLLTGVSILIPAHMILIFFHFTPIFSAILSGIAYSLVSAALWPSLSIVVSHSVYSSSVGLMMALQNFGLLMFPLIVGFLRDHTGSYFIGFFLFILLDAGALLSALSLFFIDRKFHAGALDTHVRFSHLEYQIISQKKLADPL